MIPPVARPCGQWLDATRASSLQRVANRPLLCHVLDALMEAGIAETAVLSPPDLRSEVIACIEREGPPGARTSLLDSDAAADPAGTLAAIARFASGLPAVVHRSDGLLCRPLRPLLDLPRRDGAAALLLVAHGVRRTEPLGPGTQRALRLAELDPQTASLGLAGMCVLAPGTLDGLAQTRIVAGALGFTDLAEALLARGTGRVEVRVVREWRALSGEVFDLLDVNRAVLDRIRLHAAPEQSRGNRLEGRVLIDATASVSSSVISGPAIIGAGAIVSDSYIGPHTSIGERARLEGAEIERSIVFAGASILHVGGRLVGSVVGRDARVFKDFSVPRAMRLQVGDGDEIALC